MDECYTEALREAIGKLDGRRLADARVRDELGALDRWIGQMQVRAESYRGRLAWLEAERKAPDSTLEALASVLRAGADALQQQRMQSIAGKLARVRLEDDEIAVVIDSLAAMRDRLAEEGTEAPNVERALRRLQAVIDPGTSIVEIV